MKLLFDLKATQPSMSTKRHGGGKYGEVIFFRMIERGIKFSCFYDSNLWLNPLIEKSCKSNNIPLYDLQELKIEDIIKQFSIDRLYSCLPGKYANLMSCEVYGTIHGMRIFETPWDHFFYRYKHNWKQLIKFTLKWIFNGIIKKYKRQHFLSLYIESDFHLITVSEHSKYAFYSYFPEIKRKYFPVFYSPNTSCLNKAEKKKNAEKYFLLVSGNRWEKNNLRAIIAFDRVLDYECMGNVRMKITGTDGSDFRYNFMHPERFDFLGYVEEDELESLYANAYVFVYPSLNEGFGYPPLEAMRYGVPVIASPISSMAEICGAGALYFNPFSIEEIMNRMLMMTSDVALYEEYSKRGVLQYQRISKRQSADLDGIIDYILSPSSQI